MNGSAKTSSAGHLFNLVAEGQKTWHNEFFVTDKITKGEDMLAYFLTKPPHGALFVCMHENILDLLSTIVHKSVLDKQNYCTNKGAKLK